MSARDIYLMERHRTAPVAERRDLSDDDEKMAVDIALNGTGGAERRLRERIVSAALQVMAEEGYSPHEFLEG